MFWTSDFGMVIPSAVAATCSLRTVMGYPTTGAVLLATHSMWSGRFADVKNATRAPTFQSLPGVKSSLHFSVQARICVARSCADPIGWPSRHVMQFGSMWPALILLSVHLVCQHTCRTSGGGMSRFATTQATHLAAPPPSCACMNRIEQFAWWQQLPRILLPWPVSLCLSVTASCTPCNWIPLLAMIFWIAAVWKSHCRSPVFLCARCIGCNLSAVIISSRACAVSEDTALPRITVADSTLVMIVPCLIVLLATRALSARAMPVSTTLYACFGLPLALSPSVLGRLLLQPHECEHNLSSFLRSLHSSRISGVPLFPSRECFAVVSDMTCCCGVLAAAIPSLAIAPPTIAGSPSTPVSRTNSDSDRTCCCDMLVSAASVSAIAPSAITVSSSMPASWSSSDVPCRCQPGTSGPARCCGAPAVAIPDLAIAPSAIVEPSSMPPFQSSSAVSCRCLPSNSDSACCCGVFAAAVPGLTIAPSALAGLSSMPTSRPSSVVSCCCQPDSFCPTRCCGAIAVAVRPFLAGVSEVSTLPVRLWPCPPRAVHV